MCVAIRVTFQWFNRDTWYAAKSGAYSTTLRRCHQSRSPTVDFIVNCSPVPACCVVFWSVEHSLRPRWCHAYAACFFSFIDVNACSTTITFGYVRHDDAVVVVTRIHRYMYNNNVSVCKHKYIINHTLLCPMCVCVLFFDHSLRAPTKHENDKRGKQWNLTVFKTGYIIILLSVNVARLKFVVFVWRSYTQYDGDECDGMRCNACVEYRNAEYVERNVFQCIGDQMRQHLTHLKSCVFKANV